MSNDSGTQVTSLRDLAELAGVSPMTVSRVFSGRQRVATSTRDRVLALAREHGYQPNLLARSLRGGQSWTIGVLCSLSGPHAVGNTIRHLTLRMREQGYAAQVADHIGMQEQLANSLDNYRQRSVDGVLLQWDGKVSDSVRERLAEAGPTVLISKHPPKDLDLPNLDFVRHDAASALGQLAQRLIANHRSKPAFLLNPGSNRYKMDRVHRHLPFPVPESALLPLLSSNPAEEVAEALDAACRDGVLPYTALVCGTDDIAAAALAWLQQHQIPVPDEVAVAGFNNAVFSAYSSPPLTTIERHDRAVITAAWELLEARIQTPSRKPVHQTVAMELIARASLP